MDRKLVEHIVDEAREEEANLIVTDRRDTFSVKKEDVPNIEVADDYLKVTMEDGKATVYIDLAEVYKLVVEKDKARKTTSRTGFGAARED